MDPLSISASIIAIVGLGSRLSRIIWTLRQHSKTAPQELAELATEISTLRLVLQRLESTSWRPPGPGPNYHETGNRGGGVPVNVVDNSGLTIALRSCGNVVSAVEDKIRMLERLFGSESTPRTVKKMVLVMSSPSVRQVLKDLLLSLQFINMGILRTATAAQHSRDLINQPRSISKKQQNHIPRPWTLALIGGSLLAKINDQASMHLRARTQHRVWSVSFSGGTWQ